MLCLVRLTRSTYLDYQQDTDPGLFQTPHPHSHHTNTQTHTHIHSPNLARPRGDMPSKKEYSVESRYTSRKALEEKLKKIFPSNTVVYFEIKVSSQRQMLCVRYSSRRDHPIVLTESTADQRRIYFQNPSPAGICRSIELSHIIDTDIVLG